ncbi:MAG: DNA polymerase/3'-5' exonuclease PolX [Candidatus Aenigmarchaeota archaeon]|nr:DNA polymerase/3'-5' exonuclease PolX [Candidatus Aenigmarchaeota archaeon]
MKNQEVAKLLYDIADMMEIRGEMIFKIVAYRRAAQAVESLSRDIEDVWRQHALEDVPGIGKGIAEKISEYLEKGKLGYLDELRKGLPPGFEELLAIEGIGPKKVKMFHERLRIRNVKELEKAAKQGKLRKIPTLGEKTEQNILHAIEAAKKRGGRMLLGYALLVADEIIAELKKNADVDRISTAGSLRRMKETIGDIDILVTSARPNSVLKYFTRMKGVSGVIAQGPTKASVRLASGMQVDLRVLKDMEYGSALMYFTGSKEHNVALRKIAIAKRMKLSEYGLFQGNKFVAGRAEQEVYKKLGLEYIEPEMRENRGEIELAKKGKLPKLIGYRDIRGDLQMHTKWSDGANMVGEMAKAAKEMGYEYICITDHAGGPAIANALNGKRLEKQRKEINSANKKTDITILQGAEVDIRKDGKIGIQNTVLKELDIVLASLHSALRSKNNTVRIISAMENPNVDIIAHPSGRLLDKREGSELDMEKITQKAKETNTILEIDAQPERLDLSDVNVKAAIEAGCMLSIDTDAHSTDQLRHMRIGIATARRGWAPKNSVINTYPLDKMRKMLK